MAKIHVEIPKIMADIGTIGKSHKNQQQGYAYRAVDDVMAVAQEIFASHGVFVFPKVERLEHAQVLVGVKQTQMIHVIAVIEYHFVADDGSEIVTSAIGEATDTGDKAANKAMASAYKYAVTQTLSIPTSEPKDTEIDSPDLSRTAAKQPKDQPKQPAAKPPLNLVAFKKCIDIELKKYPDAHAAIEAIGAIRELTVEAEAMIQDWFTTQRPVNG